MANQSDEFITRVSEFYKSIRLPANLPRPLPNAITKKIDGISYKVTYNKYGFPNFADHMTPIKVNGIIVRKKFDKDWTIPKSKNKVDLDKARKADLKNATSWALEKDASGKLVNFPDGKVRAKSNEKIEILKDGGDPTKDADWIEQTWHHHENGKDIIPIPTKLHNTGSGGLAHSGGMAVRYGDVDITSIIEYSPFD